MCILHSNIFPAPCPTTLTIFRDQEEDVVLVGNTDKSGVSQVFTSTGWPNSPSLSSNKSTLAIDIESNNSLPILNRITFNIEQAGDSSVTLLVKTTNNTKVVEEVSQVLSFCMKMKLHIITLQIPEVCQTKLTNLCYISP